MIRCTAANTRDGAAKDKVELSVVTISRRAEFP
jgi:hypothetical protein